MSTSELIDAVRKDLFQALRDLMQHGLIETSHNTSLVPAFAFACFPIRAKETHQQLHIWDLFLKYYEVKVQINWIKQLFLIKNEFNF